MFIKIINYRDENLERKKIVCVFLAYAFAELIDNALAATVENVGPRNIEIRLVGGVFAFARIFDIEKSTSSNIISKVKKRITILFYRYFKIILGF